LKTEKHQKDAVFPPGTQHIKPCFSQELNISNNVSPRNSAYQTMFPPGTQHIKPCFPQELNISNKVSPRNSTYKQCLPSSI